MNTENILVEAQIQWLKVKSKTIATGSSPTLLHETALNMLVVALQL